MLSLIISLRSNSEVILIFLILFGLLKTSHCFDHSKGSEIERIDLNLRPKRSNLSRLEKLQNIEARCLEREEKNLNAYPKRTKKDKQQASDQKFMRRLNSDALSEEERKVFDRIESWK